MYILCAHKVRVQPNSDTESKTVVQVVLLPPPITISPSIVHTLHPQNVLGTTQGRVQGARRWFLYWVRPRDVQKEWGGKRAFFFFVFGRNFSAENWQIAFFLLLFFV